MKIYSSTQCDSGCKKAQEGVYHTSLQPLTHRAKLYSVKFGDEAGDQTGGLIESCTRLSFPGYRTTHIIASNSWMRGHSGQIDDIGFSGR